MTELQAAIRRKFYSELSEIQRKANRSLVRVGLVIWGAVAIAIALATFGHAAPRGLITYEEIIGPATASGVTYTSTSGVNTTLSAPSKTGARNCLTEVSLSVNSGSPQQNITLNILQAATTIYTVSASTGYPVYLLWPAEDPFCTEPGRTLGLTATSLKSSTVPPGPTLNLNYKGYTY